MCMIGEGKVHAAKISQLQRTSERIKKKTNVQSIRLVMKYLQSSKY